MATYIFKVTSSTEHLFRIEADTEEQAKEKYYNYSLDDLLAIDEGGGSVEWEKPWDIEEEG